MTRNRDFLEEGDASEEAGGLEKARQLFEEGGIQGDPYCWSRLGMMFDIGIGCEVDKAKAMACYKRSWRSKNQEAAHNIAILYREAGKTTRMFQWFQRAANVGDGDALVELARCYVRGIGVRKNIIAAARALADATVSRSITPNSREKAETRLADIKLFSSS